MKITVHNTTKFLTWMIAALMLTALVCGCRTDHTPETFTVTFAVTDGNGKLEAKVNEQPFTTGKVVVKDTVVKFTAMPNTGYEVEKWIVNGTDVKNNATTMYHHKVTAKTEVKVRFKAVSVVEKYTVKLEKNEGGDVAVMPQLPEDGKVDKGTVITFTATAANGYAVDKWEIQGGSFEANTGTEGNATAKVMVAADIIVKVYFKPDGKVRYTVEHYQQNVSGADYTKVAKDTETKYGKKDEQTDAKTKNYEGFTAKPVTQQKIAGDGTTVVKLLYDRKEITLTLELAGGTITPPLTDNKVKGRFGADVPTIKTPKKEGAAFTSWNPELPKTFPAQDGTYTAQWKINEYDVTFSVDGGNGTLKAQPEGKEATDKTPIHVEHGKTVTFTATANDGYIVDKWTVTPGGFTAGGTEGSTTATVKVEQAVTVKVTFKSSAPPPSADSYNAMTGEGKVGGVSFTMKSIAAINNGSIGHNDYSKNKPHTVSLTAYRIGETEVTQELWKAVMGNEPSAANGSPASGEDQVKRPVENINWYQAIAFCNKLSLKLGLMPCYTVNGVNFETLEFNAIPTSNNEDWNKVTLDMSKNGFRLPTEAEWEWAAMGGTSGKWAGTDKKENLKDYAWYKQNSNTNTHEVKKRDANGYGLYDMSGNVLEWCWDWYKGITPEGGQDPQGVDTGNKRTVRGGSCYEDAEYVVRAYRFDYKPDTLNPYVGLRLVSRP